MIYRREIDGLRAFAVLPVVLLHAGFDAFRGGFVGVDVFFVISGFLITSLILAELNEGSFSVVGFYERRARRIAPALFLVMAACLIAGFFTLMPDEYKNLGQSLAATTLFANNVLLAMTSGYWDLTSEFKPLLHTWSLGVEEQYYLVVPLVLLLTWRRLPRAIPYVLGALLVASFAFAAWYVRVSPDWAFYTLPTRAWELLAGAILAVVMHMRPAASTVRGGNLLSFLGLCAVVVPVFWFGRHTLSPGPMLLIPVAGALMVIAFARPGTLAHSILGHQHVVLVGMISYSLYLWHQPAFAFLRIYSPREPSAQAFLLTIPFVFVAAYLSWRYVERPFRDRKAISTKGVWVFTGLGSALLIAVGLYLNSTYGMVSRAFPSDVRVADMDKRIYNERVFARKRDAFANGTVKKKLLVVGNSFARDFVNMVEETFDTSEVDIIYRNDLGECVDAVRSKAPMTLFDTADVVVFASDEYKDGCIASNLQLAQVRGKDIFYVGTKNFGTNLNWPIRVDRDQWAGLRNPVPDDVLRADAAVATLVPPANFIPLLSPVVVDGTIPIADEKGRLLSTDRRHLTKYGAIFFGEKAVRRSEFARRVFPSAAPAKNNVPLVAAP